jgi:deoxyribose-phosphate aldolase
VTTLDASLARVVDEVRGTSAGREIAERALPLLDLTSLNDDTDDSIAALCDRAVTPLGMVTAVCIYPRFIPVAKRRLEGKGIAIATVVNFPEGMGSPEEVAEETRAAVTAGADEVDVVMPWRLVRARDPDEPFEVLNACREACGRTVLMKAILETGGLDEAELIEQAARTAVSTGADFLKTSTGKLQPAATLEAAAILMTVIRDSGRPVGFKAAGGIRDIVTAASYLALADRLLGPGWATPATFRFGASGLLDALLAELSGNGREKDPGSTAAKSY